MNNCLLVETSSAIGQVLLHLPLDKYCFICHWTSIACDIECIPS